MEGGKEERAWRAWVLGVGGERGLGAWVESKSVLGGQRTIRTQSPGTPCYSGWGAWSEAGHLAAGGGGVDEVSDELGAGLKEIYIPLRAICCLLTSSACDHRHEWRGAVTRECNRNLECNRNQSVTGI